MGDFLLIVRGTGADLNLPKLFDEFLEKLADNYYRQTAIYNHGTTVQTNTYNHGDNLKEIAVSDNY